MYLYKSNSEEFMITTYTKFTKEQIAKIGNTLIYFAERIPVLSQEKAMKLLYLLDEIAIKNSGIPFLNLRYEVWKFGPINRDIYIELTAEPNLLKDFIKHQWKENSVYIRAKNSFCDDEFSDNDLELLDFIILKFGEKTSEELSEFTQKKNSPWYILAEKNNLLDKLQNEEINSTDLEIDLSILIQHDSRKRKVFEDFKETN